MVSVMIMVVVVLLVFIAVVGCDDSNMLTGGAIGLPDESIQEQQQVSVWKNGTGTAGITTYIN